MSYPKKHRGRRKQGSKKRRAKLYYLRDRKGKSARIAEKIKKKIGIDISAQPAEPVKKVVSATKEETKTEEKKDTPVAEKKTETKTSDKK